MWTGQVKASVLINAPRWRVERFGSDIAVDWDSRFPPVRLADVVSERTETVDPTSELWKNCPYVGLEHVTPDSGDLVEIASAAERGIRSRSKVFRAGDVLYGRLRAYLNKVYLVSDPMTTGVCSGEFYVLTPAPDKLDGRYLRWILASSQMVSYVRGRLAGATHPRLGAEDLLSFAFPLPTLEDQRTIGKYLELQQSRVKQLREAMAAIPDATRASITTFLAHGDPRLLTTGAQESAQSTF